MERKDISDSEIIQGRYHWYNFQNLDAFINFKAENYNMLKHSYKLAWIITKFSVKVFLFPEDIWIFYWFGFSGKCLFSWKALEVLAKEFFGWERLLFFYSTDTFVVSHWLTEELNKAIPLSMCLNMKGLLVEMLAIAMVQIIGKSLNYIWHSMKKQVSIQNVMVRIRKSS